MFDWIFTFFHFFLFLGVTAYGILSFIQGNYPRGITIFVGLTGYYFLVLHKGVKKEIQRKKEQK